MDWFRAHHGISNSKTLRVVAHMSKQPLAFVNAIWLAFLDYASQNEIRGSIDGCDIVEVAVCQDIAIDAAEEIFRVMKERNIINGDLMLVAWAEKQAKKDDSTERVRRYRDRKSGKKVGGGDTVTGNGCNIDVTICNALPSKIIEGEVEEDIEDSLRSSSNLPTTTTSADAQVNFHWEELTEDERKTISEIGQNRMGCDVRRLQLWLDAGYDLELDILPAIRKRTNSHPTNKINCLSYFDGAIRDQFLKRNKPLADRPDLPQQSPKKEVLKPVVDPDGILPKVLSAVAASVDGKGTDDTSFRYSILGLSYGGIEKGTVHLHQLQGGHGRVRSINERVGQVLTEAWRSHDPTVNSVKVCVAN